MFEKRKILFVEDDASEIKSISDLLAQLKAEFIHASSVDEAIQALTRQSFDFLLTDLHIETRAGMETPDGLMVIKAALEQQPNIAIVATSSDPRTEIVIDALAAGAHHFIRKPLSKSDELVIAFKFARDRKHMSGEVSKASKEKTPSGRWEAYAKVYPYGIVFGDREIRMARLAAKKQAGCIIVGETGTGKEEAAKLIHRMRCEEEGAIPFVAVNCATITGNLAESILFGHRKGAFTGADEATTGYIAEADRGILFLDEIQTLSIPVQQKLLRVLNDGTYNRLGETKIHRSQFQLIVASTKDLNVEVSEGRFLMDILMRMMGLEFAIPPLRDRKQSIPALLALFLSRKKLGLDDENFDGLVAKLQACQWPGNIRQLFKGLEAWLLTCELDDLPLSPDNFPIFKDMQLLESKKSNTSLTSVDAVDFNVAGTEDRDFDILIADYEKYIIVHALKRHRSIVDLSKAINLSRSTLDSKRRKFGLMP